MGVVPDLYVRQSPHPNAYTLAVNGKRPLIVCTTALVELLTADELKVGGEIGWWWWWWCSVLCAVWRVQRASGSIAAQLKQQPHTEQAIKHPRPPLKRNTFPPPLKHKHKRTHKQAVLAHELAHICCDHGVWLTLAQAAAAGAAPLLPSVASDAAQTALMRWRRAVELTCDRASLLAVQDVRVVVGALMKLAGGCRGSLGGELSVDAFLDQARSYDEAAAASPLGWYLARAQRSALSHPLPVLRAREVDRWAQSDAYRRLLEGR